MLQGFLKCPSCRRDYEIETGIFSCLDRRPREEHTLRRVLPPGPEVSDGIQTSWAGGSRQTFEVLRHSISAYRLLGHDRYHRVLERVAEQLLRMEDRDFKVTPLTEAPALASALGRTGRLWVKDETGNVTGSHKGRHLMATLLYLEALRTLKGESIKKVLAIYSCGNAALGASAVARAGGYELHAFVPEDVDPTVTAMLMERRALVERIPRSTTGEGDLCYLAFRKAINEQGWIPFACAGNDNCRTSRVAPPLGGNWSCSCWKRPKTIDSVSGSGRGRRPGASDCPGVRRSLPDGDDRGNAAHPRLPARGRLPIRTRLLPRAAGNRPRRGLAFDLSYDRTAEPISPTGRASRLYPYQCR